MLTWPAEKNSTPKAQQNPGWDASFIAVNKNIKKMCFK